MKLIDWTFYAVCLGASVKGFADGAIDLGIAWGTVLIFAVLFERQEIEIRNLHSQLDAFFECKAEEDEQDSGKEQQ